LAVFINVSIEESGQNTLVGAKIIPEIEEVIKACKTSETLERSVIERSFNLMSKLFRKQEAVIEVAKLKHTVFKTFLFMNRTYAGELQMNALRVLHPLCKSPGFREVFFEEHKFPEAILTTYIKEAKFLFNESMKPG
jgi:hypothetical protein